MTDVLRTNPEAELIENIQSGVDRFYAHQDQPPAEIRTSITNAIRSVCLTETPESLRALLQTTLTARGQGWKMGLFDSRYAASPQTWETDLKPSAAGWLVNADLPQGYGSTMPSTCASSVTERLVKKHLASKGPHV